MSRVLVLFAHPAQQHSRVNLALATAAQGIAGITFVDLYARYPRFQIDVDAEQAQLETHEVLVLQFPVYWYSTPAILKEWQDLVLEYGWAYGPGGTRLAGKLMVPVVSLGSDQDSYSDRGRNGHDLRTFMAPLEATANLCQMTFVPPLALFAAHKARTDGRARSHADHYTRLLCALRDDRFEVPQTPLLDPETLPEMKGV